MAPLSLQLACTATIEILPVSIMPREGEEVTEAVPVAVAVEKADREGVAEGGGVPVVA